MKSLPSLPVGTIHDPANHRRDERKYGSANAEVADGHDEHVQAVLERRAVGLDNERLQDDTPLRGRAHGDDDHATGSLRNGGAREQKRVFLVILPDIDGLARHRRLVCFEFAPLHEDAICRNLVARDELHEVADNHLPRGHHVHLPAAHNLHVVVILDAVELSKLKLLDVVDVRLEEHDDERRQRWRCLPGSHTPRDV